MKLNQLKKIAIIIGLNLLLAASAAGHYYFYRQSTTQQALLSDSLTRLEHCQQAWQDKAQELIYQLAQQAEEGERIKQIVTLQTEQLQQLQQQINYFSSDPTHHGLLTEVHQLIKRAAYTMWLEQDGRAADQLLQRADLILATLHDVKLLPIRQALAQDREQLVAISYPEGEPCIVQLMQLAAQVAELPLATVPQLSREVTQYPTPPTVMNATHLLQGRWQQLCQYGTRFLKNFITIQQVKKQSDCFMHRFPLAYQRECLRINLLSAAQALAQHRTTAYQQALNNVMKGVTAHFDLQQQPVQTFLQQIKVLRQQPIISPLLQPFDSQRLLAQLLQQRTAKELLFESPAQ